VNAVDDSADANAVKLPPIASREDQRSAVHARMPTADLLDAHLLEL
jgi:hypothetical protein